MSSVQLRYNIATNPLQLEASQDGIANTAQLIIVATNLTNSDVSLAGVAVAIKVGSNGSDLTDDPSSIAVTSPLGWVCDIKSNSGVARFVFTPSSQSTVLKSQQSLVLILSNVRINDASGISEINITEGSDSCVPPNCPEDKLNVTKFPAGWGIVSFIATDYDVLYDGSIQLSWSGPSGATYSLEYSAPTGIIKVPLDGEPPFGPQGTYPAASSLQLTQTTTFTLIVDMTINDQSYHSRQQVTVTVGPKPPLPVIAWFVADRNPVVFDHGQETVILSWSVSNADRLEIEVVGTGNKYPVTGNQYSYTVSGPTTVELHAINRGGEACQSLSIQNIAQFLAGKSFSLSNTTAFSQSTGSLREELNFDTTGLTGQYSYNEVISTHVLEGPVRISTDKWAGPTTWSVQGDIITVICDKGTFSLRFTGSAIAMYGQQIVNFLRTNTVFQLGTGAFCAAVLSPGHLQTKNPAD